MSTTTPRSTFDDFLGRALQNVDTRAAYEDSQSRHRVVDALVRLRNRLGLTQTAVAKQMGVKQPSVSGFETEGSDPRLSTLQRYARAVDASIWIYVQPNASTGQRVDYYCCGKWARDLSGCGARVSRFSGESFEDPFVDS